MLSHLAAELSSFPIGTAGKLALKTRRTDLVLARCADDYEYSPSGRSSVLEGVRTTGNDDR